MSRSVVVNLRLTAEQAEATRAKAEREERTVRAIASAMDVSLADLGRLVEREGPR